MQTQNFKNHARFVPLYHYIGSVILVAVFIGSIINLFHSAKENLYSASLIFALSFVVMLAWWYLRAFALKAQDRAIRAEENFRHFGMTGKPFDRNLRMSQIIALRFASDEEFVELAKRAVAENLSSKQIKEAIQNWRADNHRV